MTPRRTITYLGPVVGLGLVAGTLATSCACWTLDIPSATAFVSQGLAESFDVVLTAKGPTEFSLLPLPRLGFRDVRLNAGVSDGPVLAEGGNLAVQLDLKALLLGRVEPVALTLDGSRVTLPREGDDDRWAGPLARLNARLTGEAASHPRRVTLSRVVLAGDGPGEAAPFEMRDVELAVSWPFWSEAADISGSVTWRQEVVRIAAGDLRPAALTAGATTPFRLRLTWAGGSLGATGSATWRDGLRASGEAVLTTGSLPETLTWLGTDMALAPLVNDVGIATRFKLDGGTVELPTMQITTGGTVLDGAGSIELSGRRPSIRATLDADQLNLGPLLAGALRVAGFDGDSEGWGRRSLALKPLTGGDLDLRLSGDGARLGPLSFGSLAASVMVREDSIDVTLNRADFDRGTLKGHLHLISDRDGDPNETKVRADGAFDGLDLSAVLVAIGQSGWVLGSARGAFSLEGKGYDAASLVSQVKGRATLSLGNGALAGLDLADVVAQKSHAVQAPPSRRAGRTAFERMGVTLDIQDGVAEIAEGALVGRGVEAVLSGRVSLSDRKLVARADVLPRGNAVAAGTASATGFAIAGPWSAVSVAAAEPAMGKGPDPMRPSAAKSLPTEVRAYAP